MVKMNRLERDGSRDEAGWLHLFSRGHARKRYRKNLKALAGMIWRWLKEVARNWMVWQVAVNAPSSFTFIPSASSRRDIHEVVDTTERQKTLTQCVRSSTLHRTRVHAVLLPYPVRLQTDSTRPPLSPHFLLIQTTSTTLFQQPLITKSRGDSWSSSVSTTLHLSFDTTKHPTAAGLLCRCQLTKTPTVTLFATATTPAVPLPRRHHG